MLVYRNAVKHLQEEFGTVRLDGVRPRDVAAYVKTALDTFSAQTVNLHLGVLHDVYNAAVGEELVQVNPVGGRATTRAAEAVADI